MWQGSWIFVRRRFMIFPFFVKKNHHHHYLLVPRLLVPVPVQVRVILLASGPVVLDTGSHSAVDLFD